MTSNGKLVTETRERLTTVACDQSWKCKSLLKIYNFRNIVHFLKRILQVVDNAVFWQNVLLFFENDPLSPSF